jgi:hypothetical protein
MTMDLVPGVTDTAPPWQRIQDDAQDGTGLPNTGRSALALTAILTAVEVALACIAILVILPAALAAQGAIAR